MSDTCPQFSKRICVIGAGPAALACLKVILDSAQFKEKAWNVIAYEARDRVGGIWYPSEPNPEDLPLNPLYDSLTTNIPHPVMAYDSFPFPPSTPIFPPASTVQRYLENYTAHFALSPHIQLNTTVLRVNLSPRSEKANTEWEVHLSTCQTLLFDHVIVANGHFRKPRYPETPGLSEWLRNGKAIHSAWYRRPSDLGTGQVGSVVVVGSGPSGLDICAEAGRVAKTVINSVIGAKAEDKDDGRFKLRGAIIEFGDDYLRFEDGSLEKGVEKCILATGYEMDFPFLPPDILQKSGVNLSLDFPSTLCNSSYHVFPLAKHMFPIQGRHSPTSLVFVGLLLRGTPLSLFEAQAHAVVKAFVDPDSLDLEEERGKILRRYEQLSAAFGAANRHEAALVVAKHWHKVTELESFVYRDELYRYAGLEKKVEDWEKNAWKYKIELRREWQSLIRDGEADSWVHNVGHLGRQEWVDVLGRVLARASILI